jgi:hypothetical protein
MFSVTLSAMKKAFLLVMLLCVGTALWAQKTYFIYIQSETQTPFYVKMGGKVFSASSSGYLIMAQLPDSTYTFQLGPSAVDGELQFSVVVRQADRGFLLKKFAEGWGLFDLQSLQVIRPSNSSTGFSYGQRVRDDRFTHLLAEAADDTTLFYQPIMASTVAAKNLDRPKATEAVNKKEGQEPSNALAVAVENVPVGSDSTNVAASENANGVSLKTDGATIAVQTPLATTDSGGQKDTVASQLPIAEKLAANIAIVDSGAITAPLDTAFKSQEPLVEDVVYKKSKITRRAESSTVDGFGLVYWDENDGVVDTIQIFIPNQKFVFAEPISRNEDSAGNREENKVQPAAAEVNAKKAAATKTCNGKATDKDFFRIRKSLVAFDSETQMVIAARSSFRNKCFSAEQIKNLSTLFLTQEGKWQFLEAAFPHVPDKASFSGLQSELRDEPYVSRFKALVEH